MDIYTVSFFGHRYIEQGALIEERLDTMLHDLITQKEYVEFLIGRDGEFDLLASSVIKRCIKKYGRGNTSLVLVLPYMRAEYRDNEAAFLDYYDEGTTDLIYPHQEKYGIIDSSKDQGAKDMKQQSFSDYEYSCRKKKTRREEFLDTMEEIIPWDEWVEFIRPYYPSGKRGRPVKGIEKMLRMYLLQVWFNLSDEGIEDAIYDSYAFRKFMGINFVDEQVPDATTLLKFRHLLEKNHIGEQLFNAINYVLNQGGAMMKGGTIVDATIINAPSSTKNEEKARDPEMHQTKKGNEWRFGMKCHVGVDAGTGYVHTITATSANVHDITETHNLLREDDEVVYGDSGYIGVQKRPEIAGNDHFKDIDFRITRRPTSLPKVSDNAIDWERYIDNRKSSVRSKVEHAFHIIKNRFGFTKVRYRGIAKNYHKLNVLFASANLLMYAEAKKRSVKAVG